MQEQAADIDYTLLPGIDSDVIECLLNSNMPDSALFTRSLAALLSAVPFNPAALIDKLKEIPLLEKLFTENARVREGYTIEEHTLIVLNQFEQSFKNFPADLPLALSKEEIRLMLALHDIGKPIPASKHHQHEATLMVINQIRELLPLNQEKFNVMQAVVDNDYIGSMIMNFAVKAPIERRLEYIEMSRNGHLFSVHEVTTFSNFVQINIDYDELQRLSAERAEAIITQAKTLSVDPAEFLNTILVFYHSDTSAYTSGALNPVTKLYARPGLDYLFAINQEYVPGNGDLLLIPDYKQGLYKMSDRVSFMISCLQDAVEAASRADTSSGTQQ